MSKKWVYLFTEGNSTMRDLLGGKGAGMGEEVEQLLGSERAKPNAVIPLIGEKTRSDSRREVDPIRQSKFPGFSGITGTE